MISDKKAMCSTCRHWVCHTNGTDNDGDCKRFPPSVVVYESGYVKNIIDSRYPPTPPYELCGEYKERESGEVK